MFLDFLFNCLQIKNQNFQSNKIDNITAFKIINEFNNNKYDLYKTSGEDRIGLYKKAEYKNKYELKVRYNNYGEATNIYISSLAAPNTVNYSISDSTSNYDDISNAVNSLMNDIFAETISIA